MTRTPRNPHKPRMARITGKYVGRPMNQVSCMELVDAIYRAELGLDLPDRFEDLTLENYMAAFKAHPLLTQSRLVRLMRTIGQPAEPKRPGRWDLLLLFSRITRRVFPAVALTRYTALAVSESHGVEVLPLGRLWRPIMARRLLEGIHG